MASVLDYLKVAQRGAQVEGPDVGGIFSDAGKGLTLAGDIQKRATLSDVGLAAARGDMQGAQQAAFAGGEIETGLKLDQNQRTKLKEEMGLLDNIASKAETLNPQQWQASVAQWRQQGLNIPQHYDGPEGQKLARAHATTIKDQLERTLLKAKINLANVQSEAAQDNAATRRMAAYGNIVERLGLQPTQQQWEAENQPGGVIHAVFGRAMPYEQAPRIMQLAQARKNNIPDDEQLTTLGFTPDQIKNFKRERAVIDTLGRPMVGHTWRQDDQGRWYQEKVASKDDPRAMSAEQLQFNMENLRNAFDVIVGKVDPASGKLKGTGPGMIRRGLSQLEVGSVDVGGYMEPALNQAYKGAEHAAMSLSYALSGKQIGQREQAMILRFFVPKAGESAEIAAFKLNAANSLFQRLLEAKQRGVSDAGRQQLFDSALVAAARGIRNLQGGTQQSQQPRGAPPAAAPGVRSLSNDELLRQLNQ